MPLINVKLIEGVFTPAQKNEMITELTNAMVSIEGEALRAATVVIIEEVRSGEWGFGGRAMTTEAVHEMARTGAATSIPRNGQTGESMPARLS